MRSLRRIPAAVAISACARSPGLAEASSAARQASIASRGAAELEHQAASRHQQREADLVRGSEDQAALDQGERRGVAELRRDRVARRQVRRRGARILGAVEVLGREHQVARLEPFGGAARGGARRRLCSSDS